MNSLHAGFSASRLTIARRYRRKTKAALAALLELSPRSVTAFEDGTRRPLHGNVLKMSSWLGFPVEWFYAPHVDLLEPESLSFRSRRSMTATLRNRANAASAIATAVISPAFNSRFNLPSLDVPDLSGEEPEAAAQILRHHWKLGLWPIANMVHLLEAKGVEVYWWNEDSPCVDAVSMWRNNKPFVMLNQHKGYGDRDRWNAAHELGHLTLHRRELIADGRKVEAEADRFAAAFLLPAAAFRLDSPKQPVLRRYFDLKRKWGVSIAAMVRRSKDLYIFTEWQYDCACKEISWRGWRSQEPVEVAILPEQSASHTDILKFLSTKGIYAERIATQLHLTVTDFIEAVPLSADYCQFNPAKREPRQDRPDLRLLPSIYNGEKSHSEQDYEADEANDRPKLLIAL